jgi:signal transduction histidine kinase
LAALPQDRAGAQQAVRAAPDEGWFTWYWGRGVNLMYWKRWGEDRLTVVALTRARWMADLLSALPETQLLPVDAALGTARQRICLVDSSDQVVYQWGQWQPASTDTPLVEAPVVTPLTSWRLKYYLDQSALTEFTRLPIIAGLASLACGLLGLVVVLYREYSRDMREATQRVNFVNQVSHELKTPLTNIRLYADLLERDLDQLQVAGLDKPRSRLNVIMSESQRLSRLIANVLTFARSQRNQLNVRHRNTDLDDLVRDVVNRFRPTLELSQVCVELATTLSKTVPLDPDLIDQILGNLITNVQRYAATGRRLDIRTFQDGPWAVVEVSDQGPGISPELRSRLFEPFVRGASGLSDTTGTGIGLSIARRLARLHGGDLVLAPSASGARFRLTLPLRIDHESPPG